ncbi:hypothetical protein [Alkalibacillus silvisoli]|uniref:Replication protein n=1 Tax=Alkalibacillus silvisoli TaxID=392823 RepID=A0ABN1AC92_9BACI
MGIVRVEKNSNFVVMDRYGLQDSRLSWKARGILAYMLSLPDDWHFHIEELIKRAPDGEKSFRSGFQELKDHGYVRRYPVYEDRKIKHWDTVVLENPVLAENLHVEKVDVQKLHVQKEGLQNRHYTKETYKQNKHNNNYVLSLFEHWNEKQIIKHRKLTEPIKRHVNARLKDYSLEELRKAIDNYSAILPSDNHYWTHKWTLQEFMKPGNVERFLDEADPLSNFKKDEPQKRTQLQGYDPDKDLF